MTVEWRGEMNTTEGQEIRLFGIIPVPTIEY